VLVEVATVHAGDPQVVEFSCPAGGGAAVWRGLEPVLSGTTHHAEIDHTTPLRWESLGTLTDGSTSSCRLDATVESVEDDSVLVLRVGDGLLFAHLADGEEVVASGTPVTLIDVELTLWPYHV
jgi:hypothetical protein